jgi:hypothetical protein
MSRLRKWWDSRDGNGDRRGDQIIDMAAMWLLTLGAVIAFLAVCWVIASAKANQWIELW